MRVFLLRDTAAKWQMTQCHQKDPKKKSRGPKGWNKNAHSNAQDGVRKVIKNAKGNKTRKHCRPKQERKQPEKHRHKQGIESREAKRKSNETQEQRSNVKETRSKKPKKQRRRDEESHTEQQRSRMEKKKAQTNTESAKGKKRPIQARKTENKQEKRGSNHRETRRNIRNTNLHYH